MYAHEIGLRFCGMVLDAPRPAASIWLLYLIEFGHHHHFDIGRYFVQRTANQTKKASDLGEVVTNCVPRDRRHGEFKFFHHATLNCKAFLTKRSECADCATKFAHEYALFHLLKPLHMPVESCKPNGNILSKGHRDRLLKVAAADHRSVSVLLCKLCQRRHDHLKIDFNELQGMTNLQNSRSIRDVLGRGSPVAPLAQSVFTKFRQLLNHWKYGVSNMFGRRLQQAKSICDAWQ